MVVPGKISHAGKPLVAGQGWPAVGPAFQGPTLEGFSYRAITMTAYEGQTKYRAGAVRSSLRSFTSCEYASIGY